MTEPQSIEQEWAAVLAELNKTDEPSKMTVTNIHLTSEHSKELERQVKAPVWNSMAPISEDRDQ